MSKPQPTDLLDDFRHGKSRAFTQLIKLHNRSLRYFAWTIVKDQETAEEIANDGFVKLWQSRHKFTSLTDVRSFLYVVTRHACINHVQSAHTRRSTEAHRLEAEQVMSNEPDMEAKLIELELLEAIYREIEKLPDKQRQVFQMTYLEVLSVEEISAKLGISANAVYLNKSLAVRSLQRIFKNRLLILCFFLQAHLWKN
ncbi:RNA polymerase sigma factor [Parapedobacter deserti]|uniref:RNA polymerase sigma factor n=1 Tax=Parapedobacter deserti TaxID=1912957 RepID=A0ABV7JNU0_9SPHI